MIGLWSSLVRVRADQSFSHFGRFREFQFGVDHGVQCSHRARLLRPGGRNDEVRLRLRHVRTCSGTTDSIPFFSANLGRTARRTHMLRDMLAPVRCPTALTHGGSALTSLTTSSLGHNHRRRLSCLITRLSHGPPSSMGLRALTFCRLDSFCSSGTELAPIGGSRRGLHSGADLGPSRSHQGPQALMPPSLLGAQPMSQPGVQGRWSIIDGRWSSSQMGQGQSAGSAAYLAAYLPA